METKLPKTKFFTSCITYKPQLSTWGSALTVTRLTNLLKFESSWKSQSQDIKGQMWDMVHAVLQTT